MRSQNAEARLFFALFADFLSALRAYELLIAESAKKIRGAREERAFRLLLLHSDFCILYFVFLHLNHRDPLSLPLF